MVAVQETDEGEVNWIIETKGESGKTIIRRTTYRPTFGFVRPDDTCRTTPLVLPAASCFLALSESSANSLYFVARDVGFKCVPKHRR